MIDYKNILFCTDFSEDANIAFLHALDLAKKYGAKLHLFHVPHSSYSYLRQVVDEHIPDGSPGGERPLSARRWNRRPWMPLKRNTGIG